MSLIEFILPIVAIISTVFFVPLIGSLMGYFTGFIVSLFLGDTIYPVMAALGIKGISLTSFGAFLGFVGGFFRTSVTTSK
jgi:hypothetical protein